MKDFGSGGNLSGIDRDRPLVDFGVQKLWSLAKGLGLEQRATAFEHQFRSLMQPWAGRSHLETCWPSDITDDGSPFEFSVAFTEAGDPDLRVLVEAMDPAVPPNVGLHERWAAAWDLTRRLASERPEMDCSRLEHVADLFEPTSKSDALFAMWHALSLCGASVSAPKVYLNPQMQGPSSAPNLVRQALLRLGCRQAWTDLSERLGSASRHKFVYFSLDLAQADTARTKVYVAHPGATASELEHVFAGTRGYRPGDVTRWCRSTLGTQGSFRDRPVLSCFAYTRPDEPPMATLHLPIRCYLPNDEVALRRIEGHLPRHIGDMYRDTLRSFAGRDLAAGRGLQTYASFRREADQQRLTIYLSPEAHAVSPATTVFRPAEERLVAADVACSAPLP